MDDVATNLNLRRVVRWVTALNVGYFGIEFAVALAIGSVSLFADSIDFLEDASISLLITLGLGWNMRRRSGSVWRFAGILLIPGLATLWTAWRKFMSPVPPQAVALTLAATGAMLVNLVCALMLARFVCALMLARFRAHGGSLTRAPLRWKSGWARRRSAAV